MLLHFSRKIQGHLVSILADMINKGNIIFVLNVYFNECIDNNFFMINSSWVSTVNVLTNKYIV